MVRRLRALSRRDWQVRSLGEVWGYPFLVVRRTVAARAPTILLTAGMHGEEPAGVEAVLQWLAGDRWRHLRFNWLVIPCINPFGWERNRRTNAQRRDINRQFRQDDNDTPEAVIIRRLIDGRQFLVSMEFHEDVDASGFYLYEARRDRVYRGERILAAVEGVVAINRDRVIDGNETTATGLIRRDLDGGEARRRLRWPMAYRLYLGHSDNIYGSETAVTDSLARRAEAHQVALEVVCGA